MIGIANAHQVHTRSESAEVHIEVVAFHCLAENSLAETKKIVSLHVMKSHYVIPIFIPEKACPFRCVYCNQFHITDQLEPMAQDEVDELIQSYLKTFPADAVKRVAFFGGTFTGMSIAEQNHYLDVVQPYLRNGSVSEIQLSTRPDFITEEILDNLKAHGVGIVELGAQSLNDEVLRHSGRGHNAACVETAARLIRHYGFRLGLQMMVGLPHDTKERTMATARRIAALGADFSRIYPTLVVRDTPLARLFQQGDYQPLSLEEAIDWSLAALDILEAAGVTVLRVGLHPSEGLRDGSQLLAGPFHISFKELVLTERWRRKLLALAEQTSNDEFEVEVPENQINFAVGYGGSNRKMLETRFKKVRITPVRSDAAPLTNLF